MRIDYLINGKRVDTSSANHAWTKKELAHTIPHWSNKGGQLAITLDDKKTVIVLELVDRYTLPYPEFCSQPWACRNGRCEREIVCND